METIETELVDNGGKEDKRGRRITAREERAAMIAAYERSGMTQRAFAKKEGIRFFTFIGWLRQRRQKPARSGFAEVRLPQPEPRGVEVVLPNGLIVRGVNAAQIAVVVEHLRRC